MAYDDLRDWIKKLDKAGELKRIKAEVDPILEMAEIADRVAKLGRGTAKAGGPALLFENVKGYPGARVLMNQFGSTRRMQLALETDSLDAIADRIRVLLHPQTPTSMMEFDLVIVMALLSVRVLCRVLGFASDAISESVQDDLLCQRGQVFVQWPGRVAGRTPPSPRPPGRASALRSGIGQPPIPPQRYNKEA